MARGRFLNASIAADLALNSLSLEAHWLYMMTIPHLDRDGLIIADTYVLFGKVCPRRPELIGRIDDLIAEWVASELVIVYPTRKGKVAFFKGFGKNQQGMHYSREAASDLDVPSGYERTDRGVEPIQEEVSSESEQGEMPFEPTPDQLPTNSGLTPAELEVEVKEEGESVREAHKSPPRQKTRQELTRDRASRLSAGEFAGCNPKLLTVLTNEVKHIYGYDTLIDDPGDDKLEDKLRREAYRLWQTGFQDVQAMEMLADNWRTFSAGFKIKRPQGDQLYELAVSLANRVDKAPASVSVNGKGQYHNMTVQRVEGEDW
jgi:hypothetical protein